MGVTGGLSADIVSGRKKKKEENRTTQHENRSVSRARVITAPSRYHQSNLGSRDGTTTVRYVPAATSLRAPNTRTPVTSGSGVACIPTVSFSRSRPVGNGRPRYMYQQVVRPLSVRRRRDNGAARAHGDDVIYVGKFGAAVFGARARERPVSLGQDMPTATDSHR